MVALLLEKRADEKNMRFRDVLGFFLQYQRSLNVLSVYETEENRIGESMILSMIEFSSPRRERKAMEEDREKILKSAADIRGKIVGQQKKVKEWESHLEESIAQYSKTLGKSIFEGARVL